MKLITSTLSIAYLTFKTKANHWAGIDRNDLDQTQSCSSKTDMAGYECCNGDLFYNCLPTDAITNGQCNCNADCAAHGDCCNDQASFCTSALAGGPTTTES